jgi:hypothetical protein
MSSKPNPIPYALKRLALLDRQTARVLALAQRPGLSDKELRHLCRAMYHLLRCRRAVMASCEVRGSDDA